MAGRALAAGDRSGWRMLETIRDGHDAVGGEGLVADELAREGVCVAFAEIKDIAENRVDCQVRNESTVANENGEAPQVLPKLLRQKHKR